MNLQNTAQVALEDALRRYVDRLMDTALADGNVETLIANLRGANTRVTAIETALEDL